MTKLENRDNKLPYYYLIGKYFGYPECCIADFCSRTDSTTITDEQDKAHDYSGFIPCHSCSVKIINNEITIHDLIKNRSCNKPFPFESTDQNYVNSVWDHYRENY